MLKLLAAAVAAFMLAACASGGEDPAPADQAGTPSGETGGMCAGIAGIRCINAFDYCAMPVGECARVADAAGKCAKKPEVCTRNYRPVCGCDGRTYANACVANAAGTSIAAEGPCGS